MGTTWPFELQGTWKEILKGQNLSLVDKCLYLLIFLLFLLKKL